MNAPAAAVNAGTTSQVRVDSDGKKRKGEKLVVGDLVLLRRFDVARSLEMKLESQWEGP